MKETTIAQTPNGRNILLIEREGQRPMFAVQPPNDNYWEERRTPRAAVLAAGWGRKIADFYRGDYREW